MAARIRWSPEALEDIEQIASYIEQDSAWYARAVARKFIEAADSLEVFPLRGRIVPETRNESIRELFVYSYRLIYWTSPNLVEVLAVIHGHRILPPSDSRLNRGGQ